mgnify:CR=1 FL=1|jgi:hypothetical protein|tara:strand:+ start:958 stop:1191 length:234 start_codon:yes stop_codon:yes gene_type:complete
MDIALSIFWWFQLDNKLDIWDVKPSGSYISGDKNLEFCLLKSFDGHFSLILSDVSVHDFAIVDDLVREEKGVAVGLG